MRNPTVLHVFALAILVSLLAASAAPAAEYATFDAFYEEDGLLGWGSILLGGLIAVGVGAFVFFTGGTGGPVVAAIGSWIGGAMGLSGAAATNAGLALLGGGALSAGGLGMAGGTALLTAVLTFSTDLAVTTSTEYLWGSINRQYDYEELQKESTRLVTLPVPVNTSGSDIYSRTMEILVEEIDQEQPVQSPYNQGVISRAIQTLHSGLHETEDVEYRVKDQAMLALLHFLHNDYREAQTWAQRAITLARSEEMAYTLPQFVHAASLLMTEPDNFYESARDLRRAVLGESDNSLFPGNQPNKLLPVVFATYLDRMVLLYDQGELPDGAFGHVARIMEEDALSKLQARNLTLLLFREIGLLKSYQQRILAIVATDNATIRNSPATARYLERAFRRYETLSRAARSTASSLSEADLDDETRDKVSPMIEAAWKYRDSSHRNELNRKICRFAAEQGTKLGICG